MQKKRNQALIQLAIVIAIIIGINVIANSWYQRLDLTTEKRFTLTEPTRNLLSNLEDVVYVRVYLEGEFPAGFKRLRNSTAEMLNEFRAYTGNNLEYEFTDPMESGDKEEQEAIAKELMKKGLKPRNLIESDGGYSEKVIFPGAIVTYKGRELAVTLLQEQLNKGPQETLNNSIALLEYNLANAIQKLQRKTRPKIGFLTGHGELSEPYVRDMVSTLSTYYVVEQFDLTDNVCIPPEYNAIVMAKPTKKFEESNKYKIDQYIMNGGRMMWLLENMNAELDSMNNRTGSFIALDYGLNLEDMLFKYGARVNFNLVQDMVSTQIPVTVGTDQFGNSRQMRLFRWMYSPVVTMFNGEHPVTKNMDAVVMQFAGTIDTVKTKNDKIKKTVLLNTSPYTKTVQAPIQVSISETREMAQPNPDQYKGGAKALAVALEGEFTSAFRNRLAFNTKQMVDTIDCLSGAEQGKYSKMVVIADGDIIKNDYNQSNSQVSPLGYYKFTKENFANKELLLNAIEWLTDENGIIEARNKDVKLRLLDEQKIAENQLYWQLVNMILPIVLVVLFGVGYTLWRRKRYA